MFYKAYYKGFQPKIYFNFFIFVCTNSHKVVVFCGWSLNISEYKLIPSNRSFVLTLNGERKTLFSRVHYPCRWKLQRDEILSRFTLRRVRDTSLSHLSLSYVNLRNRFCVQKQGLISLQFQCQ